RGRDREAVFPRERPCAPAARERRDGADSQSRGARSGEGRRPDALAVGAVALLGPQGAACARVPTASVVRSARRGSRTLADSAGVRDADALLSRGEPSSRGGFAFEESPDITGQGGR